MASPKTRKAKDEEQKTKTVPQPLDFAWTLDGKNLLLAKGENTTDVILMSNFH